jgi:hypothetical protein
MTTLISLHAGAEDHDKPVPAVDRPKVIPVASSYAPKYLTCT